MADLQIPEGEQPGVVTLWKDISGGANTLWTRAVALVDGNGNAVALNSQGQILTVGSGLRAAYRSYRTNVTGADLVATPNTLAGMSGLNIGGGGLAASTSYNVAYAVGNAFGPTKASTAAAQNTGGGNNAIRAALTIPAGCTYAEVFLSTDANPKWVGRVTATQLAAGGCRITGVGVVDNAGAAAAGSVDIAAIGTGVANNAAPFAATNALVLPGVFINCAGYNQVRLALSMSVSDLRSAPSLSLAVLWLDDNAGQYVVANAPTITLLGLGQPLLEDIAVTVSGAGSVQVIVTSMAGQGASLNIDYTLV